MRMGCKVIRKTVPTSVRPLELPTKKESLFRSSSRCGACCTLNVSSLSCDASRLWLEAGECVDGRVAAEGADGECEWMRDSMSIFSSFSSSSSFSSRTSASRTRTRSSNDSVYPLGKARRLSLSLVLHSNPTFVHCVQLGRMPSHRIFFERQRSQAWAMRLWQLEPTLITFMGKIPGMVAVVGYGPAMQSCCSSGAQRAVTEQSCHVLSSAAPVLEYRWWYGSVVVWSFKLGLVSPARAYRRRSGNSISSWQPKSTERECMRSTRARRTGGRIGDGLADVSCHLPPWLSLSLGNLWAAAGRQAPSHKG